MTISRKSHKKDRKVDGGQDLADLKFKYDLLTNELFHLREFISLVDYDPTHFNDTESFQKFLQDTHLSLEDGEEEPVNDLILTKKSTNGEHTRRRRNLRTSTIVGSDTTNYKTDDIELKLENIAPLVRNKCEKLKKKLNDHSSTNTAVPQKRSLEHLKKREAARTSKLKTGKKEESPPLPVHKIEENHDHTTKVEDTSETL